MEYIPAKQILSRNRSTAWFGTDYTMNLYRGCCHGCIYCDSRSACYGIEDFGRVRAKENALALLRDELRRKVRPGIVGMGSMSDPYNPFEGELQLTRHALELLDAYGFGAARAASVVVTVTLHSTGTCSLMQRITYMSRVIPSPLVAMAAPTP